MHRHTAPRIAIQTLAASALAILVGCGSGPADPGGGGSPAAGGGGAQASRGGSGAGTGGGGGVAEPTATGGAAGGTGGAAGSVAPGGTGGATAPDAQGGAVDAGGDLPGTGGGPGPAAGVKGQTYCLNADGVDGVDTYALIRGVLGPESLDNFPDEMHKPAMRHVREDIDDLVGPHFVFVTHRDIDRDHLKNDRQRVEITVHADGPDILRGQEGSTFTYTWRFKFAADLKVSGSFGHFFQLKSEGGNWSAPIVTLSAHGDRFEIHQISNGGANTNLAGTAYAPLRDQWLECEAHAVYGHQGSFSMTVKKLDGTVVLKADMPKADMWRDGNFTKPKWGIYRSLNDRGSLNATEDSVRFANIGITQGPVPTSNCQRK